jgi:hypothetical protein
MAWPTIEEQHAAIQSDFPEFRLLGGTGWIGIWDGPVRPISKTYRIRIVFFRRRFFDGWTLDNPYVAVLVVDPVIGAEAIKEERLLPHIYGNDQRPEYPRLCLYDPKEMTWTPEQLIATTIIPWASQWLFFYEYWQITGEFRGPGRHPERKSDRCQTPDENLDPATRARRERYRNAEFHRLGRRMGSFASSLSMAAASAGSFPRLSLPDWSASSSGDGPSPLTSILSPALQPVAFSPLAWEPDTPPLIFSNSMGRAGTRFFQNHRTP